MGNLEIYNDLVANSSGAIFADSCAGLNALCWLGRKDSSEGGHRRLRAPADLPSVATWGQEVCEERDVCSLPTSPAVVPSHCGASRERRFDSIAGEVIEHFPFSPTVLPVLSF